MRAGTRFIKTGFLQAALLLFSLSGRACMWDSTTLATEKNRRPDMAQVILGTAAQPGDLAPYTERIKNLSANRKEEDPMWWNDLAVAYMRLGQLTNAVALLKPAVKSFPNDYGVHANLGTAYHLMGRYADAEKEIARDLEINPDAHFGLEKYHLALLQFLIRNRSYQSRHLYVDEFTEPFLNSDIFIHGAPTDFRNSGTNHTEANPAGRANVEQNTPAELVGLENDYRNFTNDYRNVTNAYDRLYDWHLLLKDMIEFDKLQPYTAKWNLAQDPKLKEGVIYMASMNPKEPACFQMLGVLCLQNRDRNLAAAAFEKAIALGSPQKGILQAQVDVLKEFIAKSKAHSADFLATLLVLIVFVALICASVIWLIRRARKFLQMSGK